MLELPTAIPKMERLPVPVPRKLKVSEEAKDVGPEESFLRSSKLSRGASIEDNPNSVSKERKSEDFDGKILEDDSNKHQSEEDKVTLRSFEMKISYRLQEISLNDSTDGNNANHFITQDRNNISNESSELKPFPKMELSRDRSNDEETHQSSYDRPAEDLKKLKIEEMNGKDTSELTGSRTKLIEGYETNDIGKKSTHEKMQFKAFLEKEILIKSNEKLMKQYSIEESTPKLNQISRSSSVLESDEDSTIESSNDVKMPTNKFLAELKKVVHKKAQELNESKTVSSETSDDLRNPNSIYQVELEKKTQTAKVPPVRKRWVKSNQTTKDISIQNLESEEKSKKLVTQEKPEDIYEELNEKSKLHSNIPEFKETPKDIYEELKKFTQETSKLTHSVDLSTEAEGLRIEERPENIYEELKKFTDEKRKPTQSVDVSTEAEGLKIEERPKLRKFTDEKPKLTHSADPSTEAEGLRIEERPEDIYEELKKFTDEKSKLKQFVDTEMKSDGNKNAEAVNTLKTNELCDELKMFSHEKLHLKLSLEADDDDEWSEILEAKNVSMKSSDATRPYEFTDNLEMRKFDEEDFPVMTSKLGSNRSSETKQNYDFDNDVLKSFESDDFGMVVEEERKILYGETSAAIIEETQKHGPVLPEETSSELTRESEKQEDNDKIVPEQKHEDVSVDLKKEEKQGSILNEEKFADLIKEPEKLVDEKSLDLKREDSAKRELILPGRKENDDDLNKQYYNLHNSKINDASTLPDGTVLNMKDASMKNQRDAKYKRMKSFLQDSDEEIVATAATTFGKSSHSDHVASDDKEIPKFGSNLKSKINLFEARALENSYTQAINSIDIDLFNPKFRKNPMPLFPKTNDLEKTTNAFDTFTRKRGFGIGRAMLDLQDEKADAVSESSTPSDHVYSEYGDDEMSDVNVDMFAAPEAPVKVSSASAMDELMGMHSFRPKDIMKKRHSAASLRDAGNIPGFGRIRKWSNTERLDGYGSNWVVGDSDSEPIIVPKHSEDPIITGQQFTTNSPPESIASSLATTLSSNIETDINLSKENSEIVENESEEKVAEIAPPENTFVPIQNGGDVVDEPEWQYRLPSPPTAFRDSSPTLVENLTVYESTEQFKSDSVVTSPELFEKLKLVKETQSVASEGEKPIFNKLSLENLEKRKSLVYNRELATSLKYKDDDSQKTESISSKRSSVMSELEEVISNSKSSTLNKNVKSDNFVHSDSNLPNFKITTYDMPKKKINIFEDDSIRSNENSCKFSVGSLLKRTYVGRSMENLASRKEDGFKKPASSSSSEPTSAGNNRYKAKTLMMRATAEATVGRSESFSAANWVPINPVKRSKSQVAINQYKEEMNGTSDDGTLSKSNSLFDVSGLQSLEVMRLIQTKLKTPSNSTDELDRKDPVKPVNEETLAEVTPEITLQLKQHHQQQEHHHRYGPPSINLGTWSERPKSQITLKEDTDYKFNTSNTKLIASTKNTQPDEPTVNVRVNGMHQNLSIKVNGTESITPQPSGNVIIKIGGGGGNEKKDDGFTSRFINHTTAVGFRKPLTNVNTLDKQRPHSVAFDSNFDISRVPIVRSVELKKHFKDMHINKSITQICPQNDVESKSLNYSVNAKTNPVLRINSFSQNEQSDYTTNRNVPFAQVKLRRTDSNKNVHAVNNNNNNIYGNVVLRNTSNRFSTGNVVEKPPPPPMMPKTAAYIQTPKPQPLSTDPRDELLSAIRNFGGKKGLKSLKV